MGPDEYALTVLDVPIVGNVIVARIETFDLCGIMRYCGTIGDDGSSGPYAFEAVPHQRRNDYEIVVVGPEEHLDNPPFRGAVGAIVEQHELDAADRNCIVEHHLLMQMPRLDCARMHRREIDFAEALEVISVAAQHVHY